MMLKIIVGNTRPAFNFNFSIIRVGVMSRVFPSCCDQKPRLTSFSSDQNIEHNTIYKDRPYSNISRKEWEYRVFVLRVSCCQPCEDSYLCL